MFLLDCTYWSSLCSLYSVDYVFSNIPSHLHRTSGLVCTWLLQKQRLQWHITYSTCSQMVIFLNSRYFVQTAYFFLKNSRKNVFINWTNYLHKITNLLFLTDFIFEHRNSIPPKRQCEIHLLGLLRTFAVIIQSTVDSRYLEFQGTHLNTSRYPYFDTSELRE